MNSTTPETNNSIPPQVHTDRLQLYPDYIDWISSKMIHVVVVEGEEGALVSWTPFLPLRVLKDLLTLQTRAMRDTMVLSKKSNSFPASLKKK